jgi:glycosyltransferase involved in cell wall biosynthesis
MKRRLKIVLLIRQLILGGAESQTYELAKGLDKDKFEVVVCSLQQGGYFAPKLQAEGIPIRVVEKRWRYDATVVPRLVSLFRRENPQIVHCVMWTANMWGGLAAKLAGVPHLVVSTRSTGVWKNWLHYSTGALVFNRADVILANSSGVRNYMVEKEGILPEKIQTIYNGLDLSRLCEPFNGEEALRMRMELGLPRSGPVVGIVANLSPQKDYPTFLKAAKRIAGIDENVSFLIVGDGELRRSLEAMADRFGIADRVVFAGMRNDVDRCLGCMDVFVLCSVREGFSNALIEAMAAGLPVVATKVGGNTDAVEPGESGFLVQVGDSEALADYILRLVRDPGESRTMGQRGRMRVKRDFAMPAFLSRMENLYDELSGGKSL